MTGRPRITSSDARTLRRGALAIVVIVAIGKGVPTLSRVEREAKAAAAETAGELATLRAAAQGHRAMRDSLVVRRRRLETTRGALIRAASPQLAAAQLATSLGDYAVDAGARINATIVRGDSAFTNGMARVAVRLSVTTDIQGIAELLQRIESDPRLLAVRDLTLSGSDPGATETRAEVLVCDLLVEGLSLRETGEGQIGSRGAA